MVEFSQDVLVRSSYKTDFINAQSYLVICRWWWLVCWVFLVCFFLLNLANIKWHVIRIALTYKLFYI